MRFLMVIAALGLGSCTFEYNPTYKPVNLAVGAVRVPGSLPVFVAKEEGFFKKYGLNVTLTAYPIGRLVVHDVAAGKLDVGTSADLAVTLGLIEGKKVLLPAAICSADAGNSIVARRSRSIAAPTDLKGKTVGVTKGTTGEYFLDVYLLLHRVPRSTVKKMYLSEERLVPALKSGLVEAVATWNPLTTEASLAVGSDAEIFTARDYFDTFYLTVVNDRLRSQNPEVITRLLLALRDAVDFIGEHPSPAAEILRKYTGDKRTNPLDGYHYDITLEQSLVINLRNTLTWAKENGYDAPENINFMHSFYFDSLQAIDPDLVTVLK